MTQPTMDEGGGRAVHFPQYPENVIVPPSAPNAPPQLPKDALFEPDFNANKRFEFNGNASEYFGIWISNLILTIITIGFYAPWAKVRRLRYFYGNTQLAHRGFDFTGIPSKILMGRLIAAGVYFLFVFGGQYSPKIAVGGFILLFLVIPWLLRATFRFNARNSKYNNSRLFFSGTTWQIYKTLLLAFLIMVFTLGLLTPYAIWLYKRYQFSNLSLGQLRFKFNVQAGSYFSAILLPYFAIIGLCFVGGFIFVLIKTQFPSAGSAFGAGFFIGAAAFYLGIFIIVPLIQARLYKATWNQVALENNQFHCDVNQWRYTWIVVTNWIARIFSFGLLSAWAAIRIYRYKIESLSITLVNQPDELLSLARQEPSAFAEELTDILDIDVSL